jgi:surface polysaccharide O-acyltransferase-like enzyme
VAEAFICAGMILGLTVLFRRFANRPGAWADHLDGDVYGVYLIHWFVVIAFQAAIDGVALGPTAKFLIVTALALVASFVITDALRRVPAVRRVV